MAPLFSILTLSSSAICNLVRSQCSMLSVYFKCVSRFFQWIRISNKEFVSNFAFQMEFSVRNRWKCYRSLTVNRLYQKHVHISSSKFKRNSRWTICASRINSYQFKQFFHGFCTTITHHLTRLSLWTNFWSKTKRISSKNHRIHLIWLRPTFFFQNSNYHFEAFVLSR